MSKVYGVVLGKVVDVADPLGEGRVQVIFPTLPGAVTGYWAPVAREMAGFNRGSWLMPEIGDEALCGFLEGDVNHPYILGFLWNGVDKPPRSDNRVRVIRSLNGHEIEIYDPQVSAGDQGYVRIKDAHGNIIELANARITIKSVGTLTLQGANITINGRVVRPAPTPI